MASENQSAASAAVVTPLNPAAPPTASQVARARSLLFTISSVAQQLVRMSESLLQQASGPDPLTDGVGAAPELAKLVGMTADMALLELGVEPGFSCQGTPIEWVLFNRQPEDFEDSINGSQFLMKAFRKARA
jgi:hypothetical protein